MNQGLQRDGLRSGVPIRRLLKFSVIVNSRLSEYANSSGTMCTPPAGSQAPLRIDWRVLICSLLVFGCLAASVNPARAQGVAERAGARAAADQGLIAFENNEWKKAVDLFLRAEEMVHSPMHLLFLARSQVQTGQLLEAKENYLEVLREEASERAPAALARAQDSARQELKALEPRIPQVTLLLTPVATGSTRHVRMDGNRLPRALVDLPHPVNPGFHEWQVVTEEGVGKPSSRTVEEGAHLSIPLAAPPASKIVSQAGNGTGKAGQGAGIDVVTVDDSSAVSENSGWGWGMYSTLAVGVVGLGASGIFSLHAGTVESRLTGCIDRRCALTPENRVNRTKFNTANDRASVGLAVGALGLGSAGVIYWLTSGDDAEQSAASSVRFSVGVGSVGVSGRF